MLGLYGMLEFMLCCEILLLLNMADMVRTVFYVEDCGVNSCNAEYLAHLVCMNIGYGGWRKQLKSGLAPNTEAAQRPSRLARSAKSFFYLRSQYTQKSLIYNVSSLVKNSKQTTLITLQFSLLYGIPALD